MRLLTTLSMLMATMLMHGCGAITEELPTYEETSIVNVGDEAPDFTATTLQGERFTLSEHRGEVVLLILFSHTCPDCKALLDDVMLYKNSIDNTGARVVAIAREGNRNDIEEYMTTNNYRFDVVVDNKRAIYNTYATMYVPRTYLINTEGIVTYTTIEYDSSYIPTILTEINSLLR